MDKNSKYGQKSKILCRLKNGNGRKNSQISKFWPTIGIYRCLGDIVETYKSFFETIFETIGFFCFFPNFLLFPLFISLRFLKPSNSVTIYASRLYLEFEIFSILANGHIADFGHIF